MTWKISHWLLASAVILGAGSCGVLTQGTLGFVGPSPDTFTGFTWSPVPGAVAYQVIISLDRAGTAPVGISPLTADPFLQPQQIAWHAGHPMTDRDYFWVMLAFDRNDPNGVLLSITDPRAVRFPPAPNGIGLTYNSSPMGDPATNANTPASPLPSTDASATAPTGSASPAPNPSP
jgi:hypothetical protein